MFVLFFDNVAADSIPYSVYFYIVCKRLLVGVSRDI